MKTEENKKIEGLLAEFESSGDLLQAAEKLRDKGYKHFDCHSPFVVHGMDGAMGLKRSPLGWIVGLAATIGGGGALLLQWWTMAVDFPLVISGKPYFAYQAYVPITFGLAVLLSAFTALFGMLVLNGLPRFNHPIFDSDRFASFSTDSFFVSVMAKDKLFDPSETRAFLGMIGGKHIEELHG